MRPGSLLARLGRLAQGVAALALLAALIAGIPWALAHFIGWPLPNTLPDWAQARRRLDEQGIPDQTLIKALAVVVWATWAVLVTSVAAEIPAALTGRTPRRLPLASVFQPITGRLVAAVIVAVLSLAPRTPHTPATLSFTRVTPTARPAPITALHRPDPHHITLVAAASNPAGQPSPTPSSPPAASSASAGGVYVVQRGDTLWGIAEKQLGDPLRWSEIYQLNADRAEPDGRTLTDPHWIDPGWTLILPTPPNAPAPTPTTPTTPPPASPTPTPAIPLVVSPPPPAPTPTPPRTPATSPAPGPVTTTPRSVLPAPVTPAAPAHSTSHAVRPDNHEALPVRLPSGSVVAGSFASGVLAAVAFGRLRRRHAYRYQPPRPAANVEAERLAPTLQHLMTAAVTRTALDDSDTDSQTTVAVDDPDRRQHPGTLDIASRDDRNIAVETSDLSGTALVGPAIHDVARAVLAALLVRAERGAVEIVLPDPLADRLLPGLRPLAAIRHVAGADHVARCVEVEMITRTRRFQAVDAPDAISFRAANPENPLPLLLALVDDVPSNSTGKWTGLIPTTTRLGIAVVFLGDTPAATGRIATDSDRTVTSAPDVGPASGLLGVRMFGLDAAEAVAVLNVVADNHTDEPTPSSPGESENALSSPGVDQDRPSPGMQRPTTEPRPAASTEAEVGNGFALHGNASPVWPEPPPSAETARRPLAVQVLGPYRIAARGEAITTGLRARARTLLAWYLLHPQGATIDETVDALWPDTAADQVQRQFWRAAGDLRTRLRNPDDPPLDVLTKVGDYYRPASDQIACDLWEFQHALAQAATATLHETAAVELRRVVDVYHGELLQGSGYAWAEAFRQDVHRRALDAHLRLAELENDAGHFDAAATILERAIELDRYAEEPYRRLMTVHAAHGRLDAVTATWQALHAHLDELDLEVDSATEHLYRTLTTPSSDLRDERHGLPVAR